MHNISNKNIHLKYQRYIFSIFPRNVPIFYAFKSIFVFSCVEIFIVLNKESLVCKEGGLLRWDILICTYAKQKKSFAMYTRCRPVNTSVLVLSLIHQQHHPHRQQQQCKRSHHRQHHFCTTFINTWLRPNQIWTMTLHEP